MCNWLCASRIGLGWAHDAISFACHMFMHSYAYILSFHYILIYFCCLGLFWLFLSPFFSFICVSMLLWHPNANLLYPRTLFVSGHPLLLILHHLMFGFMMRRPNQTSLRTFLDEAFILNVSHLVGLLWHRPSHCHLQYRIGATVWCLGHLSICVDPGVLLQRAWIR